MATKTTTSKGLNVKAILITGVSVAVGLVIFHMVKKHVLGNLGA